MGKLLTNLFYLFFLGRHFYVKYITPICVLIKNIFLGSNQLCNSLIKVIHGHMNMFIVIVNIFKRSSSSPICFIELGPHIFYKKKGPYHHLMMKWYVSNCVVSITILR